MFQSLFLKIEETCASKLPGPSLNILEHERFDDFENDQLYNDMQWLDRSYWSEEPTYGDNQILNLAAHFDSPLNYAGFDIDPSPERMEVM